MSEFSRRQHGGRHGRRSWQRVFTRTERAEDFNHWQRSARSTQKVTGTRFQTLPCFADSWKTFWKSFYLFSFSFFSYFCSVWCVQPLEERQKFSLRWRVVSRWDMISIFMIFRENNCEKEITVSNVILFLQNLSRGLINIAAKLTNTKDVRDFFIDLVEKVRFS